MEQNQAQQKRSPLQHLQVLEGRVRLSGSALPKQVDLREHWMGIRLHIAGNRFIVRLDQVVELLEQKSLTRIPGCQDWVLGVLNLRGRLLPIHNPEILFLKPGKEHSVHEKRQVLVIDHDDIFCGIATDHVLGMHKCYQDSSHPYTTNGINNLGEIERFIVASTTIEDERWLEIDLLAMASAIAERNPAYSRQQSAVEAISP